MAEALVAQHLACGVVDLLEGPARDAGVLRLLGGHRDGQVQVALQRGHALVDRMLFHGRTHGGEHGVALQRAVLRHDEALVQGLALIRGHLLELGGGAFAHDGVQAGAAAGHRGGHVPQAAQELLRGRTVGLVRR